ncbi:sensor histidine kinase [Pengzhenrongella frigida]|uniref:histidine kinase n=1 Tax=Pengzhenrongella frigida TaxID=1259133 RepID=A0A4Q5N4A9_9MICO|nr:HAMP domain-containing sensor histidine kinase [Cellulomonas sp. HLT2-17]RYV51497.1 HAMP domain-containing histidine kinase [Cellulomonas sp. HLT2-17]
MTEATASTPTTASPADDAQPGGAEPGGAEPGGAETVEASVSRNPPAPGSRRGWSRWTLRRRLVAVLIALLAGVAGTMGVVSALALRGTLIGQLDSQLTAASDRSAKATDRDDVDRPRPTDLTELEDDLTDRQLPPGLIVPGQGAGTVNLFSRDGEITAGYFDRSGTFQELTSAQVAALEALPADGEPHSVELAGLGVYRAISTTTDDGDRVVTGLSTTEAMHTVREYIAVEAVVTVFGILLALVAGMVLVRRELRPLQRVAATATRVSERPLDRGAVALPERVAEVDTDPGTEVGQVGAALNRLLGHVEQALEARHESETQVRQFVADASHELRTPLAAIRGYAELVRHLPGELNPDALRAMGRVESESLRMTALVEDMLLLARLDAGRPLGSDEVDLAALAIDAVADAHAAGPDHVWQLDLPVGEDWSEPTDDEDQDEPDAPRAVVIGDDHRLQQVLVNLLSNARVHTPPGTVVRTTVRTDGEHVTVAIQDNGPGIPEPLRSHLFQRFTRGNAARSPGAGSTGLGLAIVDAVVGAHGGRIDVDTAPGSTIFTVTLPVAPEGSPRAAPDAS